MAKKQIATFLAPSKGLSVLGEHCYAYSGELAVGTTPVTFLEFTTGTYYIVGQLYSTKNNDDGDDMQLLVYLNGSIIIGSIDEYSQSEGSRDPIPIVIPPRTIVKITLDDLTGDNARPMFVILTGRVYDA